MRLNNRQIELRRIKYIDMSNILSQCGNFEKLPRLIYGKNVYKFIKIGNCCCPKCNKAMHKHGYYQRILITKAFCNPIIILIPRYFCYNSDCSVKTISIKPPFFFLRHRIEIGLLVSLCSAANEGKNLNKDFGFIANVKRLYNSIKEKIANFIKDNSQFNYKTAFLTVEILQP